MLTDRVIWPAPQPRWLTPYDFSRSYLLPDGVETDIPRRGSLAGYGAHDWARGHLVELHRRLGGTLLSLHYRELLTRQPHEDPDLVPEHLPVGTEVIARLLDRDGQLVTVETRTESAPHGPRGDDYWQVRVNGEVPADPDDPNLDGTHADPPSLPYLAFLVQQHLRRTATGPLAPVIPLHRNRPDQRRPGLTWSHGS